MTSPILQRLFILVVRPRIKFHKQEFQGLSFSAEFYQNCFQFFLNPSIFSMASIGFSSSIYKMLNLLMFAPLTFKVSIYLTRFTQHVQYSGVSQKTKSIQRIQTTNRKRPFFVYIVFFLTPNLYIFNIMDIFLIFYGKQYHVPNVFIQENIAFPRCIQELEADCVRLNKTYYSSTLDRLC